MVKYSPPDLFDQSSFVSAGAPFPLHRLGWKAFQDLCVSIAEECLRRPVQNFLPGNDAGRDGAFVGRWDGDDVSAGESTIQCKFTSKMDSNLTLSVLGDEIGKAAVLATKGLANDYIILTNHPVTGQSELAIKDAFQKVGVGRCRIFGADWITRQIRTSPRLRMMVPRLYGLGDLKDILDSRAYAQAQLILSAMGDDLQRLVVTEPHRQSVRAISEHSFVLLLGAPAAGKSTIGAGIAVGAADIWRSNTIKATSPQEIRNHLNIDGGQFFWVDDTWGNTQYHRQTVEEWNKLFPLMNAATKKGTRFLITSRDYIWQAAKKDLKLSAFPVLNKSQVVINVQSLTVSEKAQILYNHIKMGDQTSEFKRCIKEHLPAISERSDFLPETARRLGSRFFSGSLQPRQEDLNKFFAQPRTFLRDTIAGLSSECRAAIATLFLNGGKVRSPLSDDALKSGASVFGSTPTQTRDEATVLNGSLLLLAYDEAGPYWTYKHPTVRDAFADYVSESPELVETYLRGAAADSVAQEVVCGGITLQGAKLVVPDQLHMLLASRLEELNRYQIVSFLSYRSNKRFSSIMISRRPDILDGVQTLLSLVENDSDARLAAVLHAQGVLPDNIRLTFYEALKKSLVDNADSSYLGEPRMLSMLNTTEKLELERIARNEVLPNAAMYVEQHRQKWERDVAPDDHFEELLESFKRLTIVTENGAGDTEEMKYISQEVRSVVAEMEYEYQPSSSTSAPVSSSKPQHARLGGLFRDVDE